MTQANDSVEVTPGSGATVATHLVNSKEYQVVMVADDLGHIAGSRPIYFWHLPSQVHVAGANTVHWDMFNADASLVVRVQSIQQLPNITTAVTGVAFDWSLIRTTSVGTGGSALTAVLSDLSQTALDADITARSKPTGGAASGVTIRNYTIHSEETNAATQMMHMLMAGGVADLVPLTLRPEHSGEGIVLRQNQGLKCVQVTNSNAGNTGWLVVFTVE
jgi:hypothetical protein